MAAPKLTGYDQGQLEFVFKPIESRPHIAGFGLAVMLAWLSPYREN